VGVTVAAGIRAAHRIPNLTLFPIDRPVRPSTHRGRLLRSHTAARTGCRVRGSTLALMPRRLRNLTLVRTSRKVLARTRHSSIPDHRAKCVGSSAHNRTACNGPNAVPCRTQVVQGRKSPAPVSLNCRDRGRKREIVLGGLFFSVVVRTFPFDPRDRRLASASSFTASAWITRP
jgi:hypothetical protein